MALKKSEQDLGKSLKGFEHINRYWDQSHESVAAKILPGQYYVTISDELITTVLGSCVSACIRDRKLGIGGMNHFMLPSKSGDVDFGKAGEAERYGNYAMEHMINDILKNGGRRENLEVKLFGGGKVLATETDVGFKNIEFIRKYVLTENLSVVSEDLGDVYPRKVIFFPASGKAMVKKLMTVHNRTLYDRERKYMDDLTKGPVKGDIELF